MGLRLSETHELVAARLRESCQFYTSGRRELVELLVRAGRPMTIAELLSLRPSLAQSSTYRNLTSLESVGVVRRIVGYDDLSANTSAETPMLDHLLLSYSPLRV